MIYLNVEISGQTLFTKVLIRNGVFVNAYADGVLPYETAFTLDGEAVVVVALAYASDDTLVNGGMGQRVSKRGCVGSGSSVASRLVVER